MSGQKADEKPAKPEPSPMPKAAKSSPLPLIGAAASALVIGSALGIFVVAPRFVAARAGAYAQAGGSGAEHGKDAKKGGRDEPSAEPVVHKIENLIVNPAGSQGRRFLMMSVAIQVPDAKTEQRLRSQDPMLRDGIIGAVQAEPLDVITSPGGRDSVRVAIIRVVRSMLTGVEDVHVYLPQFVLQ